MDKRQFRFVALFSLALLGTNIGFHYWKKAEQREYQRNLQIYEKALQKQEKRRLEAKSFSAKSLPALLSSPSSSLLFKDSHFTLFLGEENFLPLEKETFPLLLSFESNSCFLKLYVDPSFELFAKACHSFGQESSDRIVTLTTKSANGKELETFPAHLSKKGSLSSPLEENEGGFSPQKGEKGLVWILYEQQPFPVAYTLYRGTELLVLPFSQLDGFPAPEELPFSTQVSSQELPEDSKRFLLENEYLQLVISSKGGALEEINLPLCRKESPNLIQSSLADREMALHGKEQSLFPLKAAQGVDSEGKTYLLEPKRGSYYPLIRRSLREGGEPQRQALALVGSYGEISELIYRVVEQTPLRLVVEGSDTQRRIRRSYEMPKKGNQEPYSFEMTLEIEGDRSDLWLTSGIPEAEVGSTPAIPLMKYRSTRGKYSDIANFDPPKKRETFSESSFDWVCNGNSFFALFLDSLRSPFSSVKIEKVGGSLFPSRLAQIDYPPETLPGYQMLVEVPKEREEKMHLRILATPLAQTILQQLDAAYPEERPEYSSVLSFTGWFSFILRPFSSFMLLLMNFFHRVTHSWGLSIFLLTSSLRLLMYPLNAKSNRSMKAMQEISPKVSTLQERYKSDPQKAQAEIVALYKEHGVNPLSGCLPIFLQIPFLFSMLHIFKSQFSLRGASFIPGWIDDLAAPDLLFSWGWEIPFIGSDFHLLPILLGATMLAQGWLNSRSSSTASPQQTINHLMTVAFTFMFYNLPAGLNLYWLFSSLLGILQQAWQSGLLTRKRSKM